MGDEADALIDQFIGDWYDDADEEDCLDVGIFDHRKPNCPMCPYCKKRSSRCFGSELYPKIKKLKDRIFYYCSDCDASVGSYRDGTPYGKLANKELRQWRMKAHQAFDAKWRGQGGGRVSRSECYTWLSVELGIRRNKCHIGMFDVDTCKRVLKACGFDESFMECL